MMKRNNVLHLFLVLGLPTAVLAAMSSSLEEQLNRGVKRGASQAFEEHFRSGASTQETFRKASEAQKEENRKNICANPLFFAQSWRRYQAFKKATESDPEVAKQFTSIALRRFNDLVKTREGIFMVSDIIEKCPQEAHAFVQPLLDNLLTLVNEQEVTSQFLFSLNRYHTEGFNTVAAYTADHFDEILEKRHGFKFLQEMAKRTLPAETAEKIATSIGKHIVYVTQEDFFMLKCFVLSNEKQTDMNCIAKECLQHMDELLNCYWGPATIEYTVRYAPEQAKAFADAFTGRMSSLKDLRESCFEYLYRPITQILTSADQSTKEHFAQTVLEHFEQFVPYCENTKIITAIGNVSQQMRQTVNAYLINRFSDIIQLHAESGPYLITSQIKEHCPELAAAVGQEALAHFDDLHKHSWGNRLLLEMLERNQEVSEQIADRVVAAMGKFQEKGWYYPEYDTHLELLHAIAKKYPIKKEEVTMQLIPHIGFLAQKHCWLVPLIKELLHDGNTEKAKKELKKEIWFHESNFAKRIEGQRLLDCI